MIASQSSAVVVVASVGQQLLQPSWRRTRDPSHEARWKPLSASANTEVERQAKPQPTRPGSPILLEGPITPVVHLH